ncbi:hypothetical protein MET9862_02380 [Methylobacterium symbioticum]|uniref:Uncharacterized protein n=1 Tax=Methylobacterium symbioticum TaxID=2584084 RepID=A0A509EC85_9HYPH|nr:hypothetical protein MET9862_02380 [Methylobacterium symbioticum]
MAEKTVFQRLEDLEQRVAELQRRLGVPVHPQFVDHGGIGCWPMGPHTHGPRDEHGLPSCGTTGCCSGNCRFR